LGNAFLAIETGQHLSNTVGKSSHFTLSKGQPDISSHRNEIRQKVSTTCLNYFLKEISCRDFE
jgi:hypothetical protein